MRTREGPYKSSLLEMESMERTPCEARIRRGSHAVKRVGELSELSPTERGSTGERRLRFWLEWDRGTMNARDLTIKFASYAHYLASREWAGEGAKPPWLLCVSPEPAQERRIQRVAQASLLSITELVLWTTTSEWLCEQGPLASIWSLVSPLSQATTALHRRGVFERSLFSRPFTTNQDEPQFQRP
jgi:hypothetical protein